MATPARTGGPALGPQVERLLQGGTHTASQLMQALGVSQPTLSRTIQALAHTVTTFRIKGDRTPRYALLRALPLGLAPRQRVYRVLASGHVLPFADVEFLAGGATLERAARATHPTRLYAGLPPYMAFAAPSGFLGRQQAQQAARAPVFPSSLRDWNDDHRVAWLLTQGFNLPGNLVFGDAALQREMDFKGAVPVPTAAKAAHYVAMASALQVAAYGSSAGGEQPKFLSLAQDAGHVIVKFAQRSSRMAQLLMLEHLALGALVHADVPAARTQLLLEGDFVFLEVQRFDRVGATGRVGLLSAGAVDDEVFGLRDSWPAFAVRCVQARLLSAHSAQQVATLAAFSELVGNNDRHFENLSLLLAEDGRYQGLAPAYDILPMRYAPVGGGVEPELLPLRPQVGSIGAQPPVWLRASRAAQVFWRQAQQATPAVPLSPEFRRLAASNLLAVQRFVAPLLPAA
jgi:hypothetical protein